MLSNSEKKRDEKTRTDPSDPHKSRRKYPRRQFHRPIGVLFDGRYLVVKGVELGEGGLSFNVDSKEFVQNVIVTEGESQDYSLMALAFYVATSNNFTIVKATARSIRKTKEGSYILGCQFIDLDFERRREIRTFVTSRALS